MKKPIQLTIPEPCHEDWGKMSPEDKGRFCGSCQKKVFDFTNATDREIAAAVKQEANLCGRFLTSQLDRELSAPAEKSTLWPVAAAAVTFLSLGLSTASAQQPVPTEQHLGGEEMLGKVAPVTETISGVVSDGDKMPIPGVTVTLEGTQISTQTDFDGKFNIDAKPGSELAFTYPGFTSQKILVGYNPVNVTLVEEPTLCEVVIDAYRSTTRAVSGMVVCTVTTSSSKTIEPKRRTFLGRFFQSIGNLFR